MYTNNPINDIKCGKFRRISTTGSYLLDAIKYADWLLIESRKDFDIDAQRLKNEKSNRFTRFDCDGSYIGFVGDFHIDSRTSITNALRELEERNKEYNLLFDELCKLDDTRRNLEGDIIELKRTIEILTDKNTNLENKYKKIELKNNKVIKKTNIKRLKK